MSVPAVREGNSKLKKREGRGFSVGIFHFHHAWMGELVRALDALNLSPSEYSVPRL